MRPFSTTVLAGCLGLFPISIFAQYEDLIDLPDAPTRTADEQGIICTIEGIQVNKKELEKGAKSISVVFLLTEQPSAYFNYYDPVKKALVFDFYDTRIGESILESIHEDPITSSTVELFQLDLNKEVEGLKPDIRDVARVSLFTPREFEYDMQEDEGVITMNFNWSKKIAGNYLKKEGAWKKTWAYGFGGLLLAGGAGYYFLQPEKASPPADPLGIPVDHP